MKLTSKLRVIARSKIDAVKLSLNHRDTRLFLYVHVILGLLLFFSVARASEGHYVAQVLKNNPELSRPKAIKIVNIAKKYAAQHKINQVEVILAVMAVESKYDYTAVNTKTKDYGIMQVNIKNVEALHMDLELLTTDLDYSIRKGVKILSYFLGRYEMHEAIMRYNCGTRLSCIEKKVAKQYLAKVIDAL